jgi:hypothetical protein
MTVLSSCHTTRWLHKVNLFVERFTFTVGTPSCCSYFDHVFFSPKLYGTTNSNSTSPKYISLHRQFRFDYNITTYNPLGSVEKSYRGKMCSLQHALCRLLLTYNEIYIYIFIIAVIVDWYNSSHSIVASTASSREHVDQLDYYYYGYYYYQWALQQRVVVVLIS